MSRTAFLRLEFLLSAALIVLSLSWAWLRGLPLPALLVPTAPNVAGGVLAGALLWGTIPLVLRAPKEQNKNSLNTAFGGSLVSRIASGIVRPLTAENLPACSTRKMMDNPPRTIAQIS